MTFFSVGRIALAGPWLGPFDLALRSDLQLLGDAGVLNMPLNTWPLSWGDINHNIKQFDDHAQLNPAERDALRRVSEWVRFETLTGVGEFAVQGGFTNTPRQLRTFQYTPREKAEFATSFEWTGNRFAARVAPTFVNNPSDGDEFRLDGSYLGFAVGNWMLAAGPIDRWWGPGWESSLILSTNARPIPGIAAQRNFSDPFDIKFLRWIGPWTMTITFGQLEDDRAVPNALFFGLRTAFKPRHNLEIGISRTAQFCGDGRPCDLETFGNLLLGRDNRGDEGITSENEPGNQLAAVDVRWASPFGRVPMALYTQWAADDEAGGLPSRWIALAGVDFWGVSEWRLLPGRFRGYVEVADTALEFYKSNARFDGAYEHGTYQSGYRYRGRTIGHSLDNDGRLYSFGGTWITSDKVNWNLIMRTGELNRGGNRANSVAPNAQDYFNIELSYTRSSPVGTISAGIGFDTIDDQVTGTTDDDLHGFVEFYFVL